MLSKLYNPNHSEELEPQEQVGGALVRILNKTTKKAGGRFHDYVETVTLSLDLSSRMTSDPHGPELFADTLVNLVKRHDPFKTSQTRAGLILDSDEMSENVGIPFQPINKISVTDIVETMGRMSQSNKSPLELDVPRVTARITYINPPSGSGKRQFNTGDLLELTSFAKRSKLEENSEEFGNKEEKSSSKKNTRSNIMLNEVLEDCLFHALHQALMYRQWKETRSLEDHNKYRSSIRKTFKRPGICSEVYKAVNVMKEKSGITKSSNFDKVDIEQVQNSVFARQYQILVFVKNSTIPYYKGPYIGEKKQLVLYLADGHYSGVRSVCALLKTDYYCSLCNSRSTSAESHYSCPLRHRLCGTKGCPESVEGETRKCEKCTVVFHSNACYENHKRRGPKEGKSRCDYTTVCKKCEGIHYTNKGKDDHKCGEKWCHRCNCKRITPHKCVMPKSKKNEKKLTRRRIYYDIESRAGETTGQQIPVLFMALRCCPQCSSNIPKDLKEARNEACTKCSPDGRLKVIECITADNRDVDVASEMTKWIFSKEHDGTVVVAHNASGYDAQFILENLIGSRKAEPKLILEGTKLVFLEYNGVRLLDSMKYLTMSLSSMGKSFEIDSVKGDFPVLFIDPLNYEYEGEIPEDKYYALENKSTQVQAKLVEFLENERQLGTRFNFVEEILRYCYNDVYILAKSMNIFETEFETMTNVCLLEESTTAASAAAVVFRRNHLDPEKPIVLDVKPSISMKSSVISQKYLAWFSKKEGVQVSMSTSDGEEKIGKYRVDGFVPPCEKYPDGLIIEFQGCYWHAHDCTFSEESMIGDLSAKEIRARDEDRIKYLKERHPVQIVWECEVSKALIEDPEMNEFFDNYEPMGILHYEKALTGGRTEVFRLYVNNKRQRLRYLDVVSLYPTVMKHEAFPIGSPENVPRSSMKTPMTTPEHLDFRGFLSCKVLPPKKLKLPVLPVKNCGKLMFALCKECAKTMSSTKCEHTDEQRAFNGTFTTVELQKALSLGYIITEVHHGVKYQHWVQNDETGEGGLFTSYINSMMAEKIYSSGWPSDVNTDAEKDAYCDAYLKKEHINLCDRTRFKKNPGRRAVSKLMLNSLWGKFAQNVDREITNIIIDPMHFFKLVYDTTIVLSIVRCVNDVLVVKYRKNPETLQSLKTSAMQLATYTTSYARLRLYAFMEKVGGENIVYTDTDSIIYAVPDGEEDPLNYAIGSYLGQLTNEVDGEMTEFVSLGPKTYCYKDVFEEKEKIVRKAKGITITSQVEKQVHFATMKTMVDEVIENAPRTSLNLPQHTMFRDRDHRIYSRSILKKFKFTFNKRRILQDGSTLPFGYCE